MCYTVDRAGIWTQVSLTPKLLLLTSPSSQRLRKAVFSLEFAYARAILNLCLQSQNNQEAQLHQRIKVVRSRRSFQTSGSSARERATGVCGRITWFENGVPGQCVGLPHLGIEALVQLDWGYHHPPKRAHHLWGTQRLFIPVSTSLKDNWRGAFTWERSILHDPHPLLPQRQELSPQCWTRSPPPPRWHNENDLWDDFPLDVFNKICDLRTSIFKEKKKEGKPSLS